jgi:RHS repeat-associated protein
MPSVNGGPAISGIQWDVFDRMSETSVPGTTRLFSYDAFGRRMDAGTYPYGHHLYFYDTGGRLLAEYGNVYGGATPTKKYEYFAGQQLGQYKDRVGSVRNTNGGVSSHYYPFGEEITSTANDRYKFAETFRDADSGLDYALNRYYAAGIGRFLSVDRGAVDFTSAQSFNRYTYVRNDPPNSNDPTGLILAAPDPPDAYGGGDFCTAALGQDWYWFNFNMTFPNPCILVASAVVATDPDTPHRYSLHKVDDCYFIDERDSDGNVIYVHRLLRYIFWDETAHRPDETLQPMIWEHISGDIENLPPESPGDFWGIYDDAQRVSGGKAYQEVHQWFSAGKGGSKLLVKGFAGGSAFDLTIYKTKTYVEINGDLGGKFDAKGNFVPNEICPPKK